MHDSLRPAAPPLGAGLRTRLSAMMFLQYAIWGSWLPVLFPFLMGHKGWSLDQCFMILSAGAVGAVWGPFVAGQVSDRAIATEKFLALSHLIGAGLVWMLPSAESFHGFLRLSLIYGVVYAPTLALTNSLAFHHLPDRDRDFGSVRVWGTIGWIAAGIALGQWLLTRHSPAGVSDAALKTAQDAGRADAFKMSAILGAVMGLYCLTLPHTPPAKTAAEHSAWRKALHAMRRQPLLTLFILAVPVSCIHQFYFIFTSDFLSKYGRDTAAEINRVFGVGGGGLMTIGQMCEIAVLAVMPLLSRRLSRKTLLACGLGAYAARMALFAYTDSLATVLLGVALHGFCFGCFIFVAFMVVDEETTPDVRASAQNLFNLVIVGVGVGVGSWLSVGVVGKYASHDVVVDGKPATVLDYTRLFSVPMWAALACLVVLLLMYPGRKTR